MKISNVLFSEIHLEFIVDNAHTHQNRYRLLKYYHGAENLTLGVIEINYHESSCSPHF